MADFAKEFKVDLSDFVVSDHFGTEGGLNPLGLLLCLIGKKATSSVGDVSVGDLIDAAVKKMWHEIGDH